MRSPRGWSRYYPFLLGMEEPWIQAYPPAAVIVKKPQALAAIGMIDGRMKDYRDLWAMPKALDFRPADLDDAIAATESGRELS